MVLPRFALLDPKAQEKTHKDFIHTCHCIEASRDHHNVNMWYEESLALVSIPESDSAVQRIPGMLPDNSCTLKTYSSMYGEVGRHILSEFGIWRCTCQCNPVTVCRPCDFSYFWYVTYLAATIYIILVTNLLLLTEKNTLLGFQKVAYGKDSSLMMHVFICKCSQLYHYQHKHYFFFDVWNRIE